MTKTQNYNLNKPEATDPLRLADFNANADIIDGALAAQANSLAALNTAVVGKGNCSVAVGTYIGADNYGSARSMQLKFAKKPLAVFIGGGGHNAMMIRDNYNGVSIDNYGNTRMLKVTWGSDGTVSWYSENSAGYQMNEGKTYTYFALTE